MNSRSNDNDFGLIHHNVTTYYETRLAEHGATARGVDWNGSESQLRRFAQLARLLPEHGNFSVNDIGCGYGALLDFLRERFPDLNYRGTDISPEMITAARDRFKDFPAARFIDAADPGEPADYSIASGIFNVRLTYGEGEWWAYLVETLNMIDNNSRRGFAFNCLTSYSDPDYMRDYLYYANPGSIFDLCKRMFSPNVALLHDYGLFEFTILVRKES